MHRIAPCAPYLPRRASDTNKYDYGRVLIVGGCVGYTGAPTLCARAALRCGAGLVSVGVPEAIYAVTAVKNDEAMPFPLPSAEGSWRAMRCRYCSSGCKSDVCVLGPGLGRSDALTALVQAVVTQSGTPLMLDADALFCRRAGRDGARPRLRAIVLTPHDGGVCPSGRAGWNRQGQRRRPIFAVRHGCTVVRKGPETVCAFPDGDAAVLRVGNPGMAKGGSGDVLAGMFAALLCQMPARDAVQTAVWLHGRAGDLCAGRMGEYAMNPTDVIAALPEVTKPIIR